MIRGTIHRPVLESAVLRGNPLGDPAVRDVPVYLPPGHAPGDGADLPLLLVLAGFTGRGEAALTGTPWDPGVPERFERLLERGEAEPAALVFPDCFTRLGGSQYMNSSATGRYLDHLVDELIPFVEQRFGCGGARERRGAVGKSSGGYGALHLAFQRPDLLCAVASHSGDAGFELCYRAGFPALLGQLDRHGGIEAFLDDFDSRPRKTGELIHAMEVLAMAAAYSPDPDEPFGIALPFEAGTGRLRPAVLERWMRWDPVVRAADQGPGLADFRLVFVDCGTLDEYALQYGAIQLAQPLSAAGVDVQHEEFEDGHRGLSYRYDRSLPLLTRALAGVPDTDPA